MFSLQNVEGLTDFIGPFAYWYQNKTQCLRIRIRPLKMAGSDSQTQTKQKAKHKILFFQNKSLRFSICLTYSGLIIDKIQNEFEEIIIIKTSIFFCFP
jgi:hypothetical protein